MSDQLQRTLKALGVTPWQAIVAIALAGFYLGEMKPKLASGEEIAASMKALTTTVQGLSTKVEVHAVLLTSVDELRAELRDLRVEVAKLQPKTASTH